MTEEAPAEAAEGGGDVGCGVKTRGEPRGVRSPHLHFNRSLSASCCVSMDSALSTTLDAVAQITSAIG